MTYNAVYAGILIVGFVILFFLINHHFNKRNQMIKEALLKKEIENE